MKFLFHNDKSTIKDELFLLMFIVICIGAGVLFYIFAPNDWIISNSTIKVFGVAWILAGVMFLFRGSSIACAQTIQKQRRNNLLG